MTISHDFGDFINAPWIVLAYLLTYMGTFMPNGRSHHSMLTL
jgi:hypothetical protein